MKNKKAIVLLSGGLDSTTCLGVAVKTFGKEMTRAVTVTYGQRHSKEIACAKKVALYYGIELDEINLSGVFQGANCSLLADSKNDIPNGTYYEQIHKNGVSTYVPFRNGLMVAAIAAKALSIDDSSEWVIILGVHSDDTAGEAYPDCSPEFVNALNTVISIGTYGQVSVWAPFVSDHKADIVKVGLDIEVPYELTWSCYKGGEKQCGKCATCIDRKEAFRLNGATDPVPYEE